MARRKPAQDNRGRSPEQRFEWFKTTAAHPEDCDKWDVKSDLLAFVLMRALSTGMGIMFGRTRDGSAISLTLYDGDLKHRAYAVDAVEFEDLMSDLAEKLKTYAAGKSPEAEAAD